MSNPSAPSDLYPGYDAIPSTETMMRTIAETHNTAQDQLDHTNAKRDFNLWQLLRTPLGLALIVFVVVMLVLLIVNPPITQGKSNSYLEEGKQDVFKMLLFAGVVALIAYFAPIIYKKLCDLQADVAKSHQT